MRIVPLIGERIKTLADAAPLVQFFFRETIDYETDELVQKGMDRAGAANALEQALDASRQLRGLSTLGLWRPG